MRGSASFIEVAWSVTAMAGLAFTFWMIFDAWLDFRAVQAGVRGGYAKARGARWWIAVGALVGNSMTAVVWCGFAVIGTIAMQYPPPPPNYEQAGANVSAGWVLIAMEVLLAAIQVWMRVVRVKVAGRPHLPQATKRLVP